MIRQFILVSFVLLYLGACRYSSHLGSDDTKLFLIESGGLYGYINQEGVLVVPPIYKNAGEFTEGLAPVRQGGTFGYIDISNKMVIPSQFDFAESFNEGLAIVYKNGIPYCIDRFGKIVFGGQFQNIDNFYKGKTLVCTRSRKMGMVDVNGQFIIDTLYSHIFRQDDGFLIVSGLSHYPDTSKEEYNMPEVGVLDSLGNVVVPFGIYSAIESYRNGVFFAKKSAGNRDPEIENGVNVVLFDKVGKELLSKSDDGAFCPIGSENCGLLRAKFKKKKFDEGDFHYYEGYIGINGAVVVDDSSIDHSMDFSENRAFVRHEGGKYSLMDIYGRFLAREAYDDVLGQFENGSAAVKKEGKWGLIDTNCNFLLKPIMTDLVYKGLFEDCCVFSSEKNIGNGYHQELYGIVDINGDTILKPIMQDYDIESEKGGLLRCKINDKLSYIDHKGNLVWQEKAPALKSQLEKLDIDYQKRGGFLAYQLNDDASQGWAKSNNIPQKMPENFVIQFDTLKIWVDPVASDTSDHKFRAHRVCIYNGSPRDALFKAQDSRLYMIVQAQNRNGAWEDIEYLPNSWCGNSYHTLTLKSKYFWEFTTPQFKGSFKTNLRIALWSVDMSDTVSDVWEKRDKVCYSNLYEGEVNPGQFWRRQDYYGSRSIMDPYWY